jgi:hypothetical protein
MRVEDLLGNIKGTGQDLSAIPEVSGSDNEPFYKRSDFWSNLGLGLAAYGGPKYLESALLIRKAKQQSRQSREQRHKKEQLRKFGQRLFKMKGLSEESIMKAAKGLDIEPMEILDAIKGFAVLKQQQQKQQKNMGYHKPLGADLKEGYLTGKFPMGEAPQGWQLGTPGGIPRERTTKDRSYEGYKENFAGRMDDLNSRYNKIFESIARRQSASLLSEKDKISLKKEKEQAEKDLKENIQRAIKGEAFTYEEVVPTDTSVLPGEKTTTTTTTLPPDLQAQAPLMAKQFYDKIKDWSEADQRKILNEFKNNWTGSPGYADAILKEVEKLLK